MPGDTDDDVFRIPIEFFTRGWVHALTDDETIAYLFLQHQIQLWPAEAREDGVPVSKSVWSMAFEAPRAHEGASRNLFRFGLIGMDRPAGRRGDGTIEDFRDISDGGGRAPGPNRFHIAPEALNRPAVATVVEGLREIIAGTPLHPYSDLDGFFPQMQRWRSSPVWPGRSDPLNVQD